MAYQVLQFGHWLCCFCASSVVYLGFLMMVGGFHMLVDLLSYFQQMTHPAAVENVKREVNIMQALSGHENVVQSHNAYEDTTCT
ncbi:putative non-specific serine/threonine protein kinase [Helianthus annuus]|nr:putative non-specific serine/threonine protein kinase [Helianthus annuus]